MKKKKTGENKITKFLGALFSYLLAVVSVIIFALFCSGRVGWFLLMIVIGAPLLSFLWTYVAFHYVSIGLSTKNCQVEKGEHKNFQVFIRNRGILPIPEISIYLKSDGRVNIINPIVSRNSLIRGESLADVDFFSIFAGLAEIEIEKAVISDFFGVLKLSLGKDKITYSISEEASDSTLKIGILPDIRALEHEDEWLLSARSAAFDGEEPEDTTNDQSATFGGFPGFEHRDYVEGDPIKRINYKLSARVGKLQVRLDEAQAVAGISMYLSTQMPDYIPEGERYISYISQCLEEFIGVAQHLYLLDFSVKVFLPGDKGLELTDERSIEALRERLAFQSFAAEKAVDESILNMTVGSLIAFMVYPENSILEVLSRYSSVEGNTVSVYISSSEKGRRL